MTKFTSYFDFFTNSENLFAAPVPEGADVPQEPLTSAFDDVPPDFVEMGYEADEAPYEADNADNMEVPDFGDYGKDYGFGYRNDTVGVGTVMDNQAQTWQDMVWIDWD